MTVTVVLSPYNVRDHALFCFSLGEGENVEDLKLKNKKNEVPLLWRCLWCPGFLVTLMKELLHPFRVKNLP